MEPKNPLPLLDELYRANRELPELRIGQLLVNALQVRPQDLDGALFNIADDDLRTRIANFVQQHRRSG